MPNSSNTELKNLLADMARELPTSIIERLATRVKNLSSRSDARELLSEVTSAAARDFVEMMISRWEQNPSVTPSGLALALSSANEVSDRFGRANELELVWTGPLPGFETLPRINSALFDLINVAEQQLLIVSYVAYSYPRLSESLRSAVARGIEVTLILESAAAEGGNASDDPANAFAESVPDAKVYRWPIDERGTTPSGNLPTLHAKCAVADDHTALLSSANFTAPAMESNIELGVLIKGLGIPQRLRTHFATLIARGTLVLSD
jgi:cardiolipin synthase A/B